MTKKKAEQRYCLDRDDSGHWYLIKVEDRDDFEAWVSSFEDAISEENFDGPAFDDCRIDGSPSNVTFTDPRCE